MSKKRKIFVVPFRAMGSPCQVRIFAKSQTSAEELAQPAIEEVHRLEEKYSRYKEDSFLSKINRDAVLSETEVDEETSALFNYADQLYCESDGLFDISSGVLRKVWDFKSGRPPNQQQVNELLKQIGWSKVSWRPPFFKMLPGMELDLGGLVKEYAADAAAQQFQQGNLDFALVELGGDIRVVNKTDRQWDIGIRDPRNQGQALTHVSVYQGALASSGNYERYFDYEGKRYSHILNPLTGWPVVTPANVSVIADSCLVAGSVATVAMLKGEDACLPWLESCGLPYVCVFNDGRVCSTL